MANSTQPRAFRYTPGDGHVYEWSGVEGKPVKIYRLETTDGTVAVQATGRTLPTDGLARTAAAFMALVDQAQLAR